MRRAIILLALACALPMAAATVAGAASGGTPAEAIADCNDHGTLTSYYSPTTLRAALAQMPVDVKEYTDCYDVIERQLFKELGSSSAPGTATTGSSSGSSFLPTWLVIVIVVLALAAITFGAMAIRRRGGGPGGPSEPGGPAASGPAASAPPGSANPGGSGDPGGQPGPGAGPPAT
ncbi:MAG TPA: hypothetical protein VMA77_14255 [Solirubrobacteraceae bacterium]|nr:hypothetical protein [Solirubrobacteraceae bacterium]